MSDTSYHDGTAALYVADALPEDEIGPFEQHLAGCLRCQHEVGQFREVAAALAQTTPTAPPPRLRESILAQIASTPQDRVADDADDNAPAAANPAPTRTAGTGEAAPEVVAYPRHARPVGWRRVPYLVAAVAIVLALAGGVWGWQTHQAAVTANRQAELVSRLVSAPDSVTRSAQMTGGGQGIVIVSQQDKQAIFVGTDLPEPPGHRVYQLWTINRTPRSAGLITSHQATVVVQLPPAALSATMIAITIEPQHGSSAPTSNPVMAFHLS